MQALRIFEVRDLFMPKFLQRRGTGDVRDNQLQNVLCHSQDHGSRVYALSYQSFKRACNCLYLHAGQEKSSSEAWDGSERIGWWRSARKESAKTRCVGFKLL